jgi:hypothetical protein
LVSAVGRYRWTARSFPELASIEKLAGDVRRFERSATSEPREIDLR